MNSHSEIMNIQTTNKDSGMRDICPNCGSPLTYYHDTERTRAVCSKKCKGWKVVMEVDHET